MKRRFKVLATLFSLSLFAAMSMGSGETSDSGPTKVGEVSTENTAAEKEESGDSASAQPEIKTEYHVGDILMDGNMQIVYVASGEYVEENEYSQPAEGKKYVFIKLAFENKGDSDESVSSFSFEGYADGYNVDQHYIDNDVSATLSPGRTTEGVIVFEVPSDAQAIEVEYETNFFTDAKLKFIYDGDKDSGYVLEGNSSASENAFTVGDIVESSDLNISYVSCEKDESYSDFSKPESGFHYVTLTFEFENKGDSDQSITIYDFDGYADGKNCEQAYFRDDNISATLSAGRKAKGTVTFLIPDDASVVEIEYVSNFWTSSRVVFTVSE